MNKSGTGPTAERKDENRMCEDTPEPSVTLTRTECARTLLKPSVTLIPVTVHWQVV